MIKLRDLRAAEELTMKKLGDKFGLAESTISLYERGLHEPDLDTVTKIAAFFGVSVDYLLGNAQATPVAQPQADAELAAYMKLFDSLDKEQKENVVQYIKFLKSQK